MLGGMTAPAPHPPRSSRSPRTGSARCASSRTPTTWSSAAAAAVARWTGQGKQVVYCMVTSGEAGIDGMAPDESREVREAEQVESARIVGVDEVDFLGLPDGILEYGVAAAPRDRRGGPAAPARDRDHQQLPRHLGRPEPQPGRPHRHRQGRARRGPRRRQPVGLQRAARRRPRAVGRRASRCGRRLPGRRRTAWTSPTPSTSGVASLRAHQAYIDGLGWEDFDPARVPRGHVARRPASGSASRTPSAFEVFPMGWGE